MRATRVWSGPSLGRLAGQVDGPHAPAERAEDVGGPGVPDEHHLGGVDLQLAQHVVVDQMMGLAGPDPRRGDAGVEVGGDAGFLEVVVEIPAPVGAHGHLHAGGPQGGEDVVGLGVGRHAEAVEGLVELAGDGDRIVLGDPASRSIARLHSCCQAR